MIFSDINILRILVAITLYLIVRLFWRINESKHLLIIALLYWLSVSIYIIYGIFDTRSLYQLSRYNTQSMGAAISIGIASLVAYFSAVYFQIRGIKMPSREKMHEVLSKYNTRRLYLFYIFFSIGSILLERYSLILPGGQVLILLSHFKWAILSLIIFQSVVLNKGHEQLLLLICIEIILSFSGFWSSFKDYLIIIVGTYLIFTQKISLKNTFFIVLTFCLFLSLSVIWTFSKGEYRKYLTGGERSQYVVQNNQFKNLSKFFEIVQKDFLNHNFADNYSIGLENLIHRVSSIEFLGMTLQQVPTFKPHENGQILKDALGHILKPRILFPDKKAIYDSELTSKYTGRKFSGADEGVSFSLGTVAEAYIDFGKYYMLIPIFLFGLWIGWMYKYFIVNGYSIIWGLCLTAPFFRFASSFSLTTSKFLGWSVTYFITFWFINKFLIKYLDQWLLKPEYKA